MHPVKALTQLEPIDGLKMGLSYQPHSMIRISSTWNYANIGKSGFSLCGAWLNQQADEELDENKPYRDMFSAEYSGNAGVSALGSYIPIPSWGLMLKGEGRIIDLKKLANPQYMVELRKIWGSVHTGIFKKHDAFGLSLLYRYFNFITTAGQLEFFVLSLHEPA